MSHQPPSNASNSRASDRLQAEHLRLLQKLSYELTSAIETPMDPYNIHFPPLPTLSKHLAPLPNDTPATRALILSSTSQIENPVRQVYFPHNRTSGPGTQRTVDRPGMPKLSINTNVRYAGPYLTPLHAARPIRGPVSMTSEEMCYWLKGDPKEDAAYRLALAQRGMYEDREGMGMDEVQEVIEELAGAHDVQVFGSGAAADEDEAGREVPETEGEDWEWLKKNVRTSLEDDNGPSPGFEVKVEGQKDEFGLTPVGRGKDEFGLPAIRYGRESEGSEDPAPFGRSKGVRAISNVFKKAVSTK